VSAGLERGPQQPIVSQFARHPVDAIVIWNSYANHHARDQRGSLTVPPMSTSKSTPEAASKRHLSMRQRKLVGTVVLLVFLAAYALLAMVVAMMLQMQNANKAIELIYYVVAGLLWTIPAALLIRWMSQDDGDPRNRPVV
jgi:Protein of unknown function (DUF2842)